MSGEIRKTLADQIVGLRHVGYIVADLEAAVAGWCRVYGIGDESVTLIEAGPTRFAFLRLADTEIELVQPVDGEIADIVRDAPSGSAGINHIAWTVRDMAASMKALSAIGVKPGHVTPNGPVDTGRSLLVYLDPVTTDGHYIELVEDKT